MLLLIVLFFFFFPPLQYFTVNVWVYHIYHVLIYTKATFSLCKQLFFTFLLFSTFIHTLLLLLPPCNGWRAYSGAVGDHLTQLLSFLPTCVRWWMGGYLGKEYCGISGCTQVLCSGLAGSYPPQAPRITKTEVGMRQRSTLCMLQTLLFTCPWLAIRVLSSCQPFDYIRHVFKRNR